MTRTIRLSALDAAFLLAETRSTPLHVAGLQIFRIPPGASKHFVSELYAYMREQPVIAAPFNYQVAGGLAGRLQPSWEVRDHVDLDYHLRFSALPHPGGERELGVLVSRLHSIHMDLSRPLWELHLIEGLENNRFAIYFKMHHALVDGIKAMQLLTLSNDPPGGVAPPIWAADLGDRFAHVPQDDGLLNSLPALVRREIESLPSLARGMSAVAGAALGVAQDRDLTTVGQAPRTIFNVKIGGQRRVATFLASLNRVKEIGRAAGGTVNDVVLATCSGALRGYLKEQGKLPEESLVAAVPVALARDERGAAGNAVTNLMARLGTDVADVRRRFDIIMRSSDAGKRHLRAMTETAALNYTMMLATPAMLAVWIPELVALTPPMYNLIISNVPGPREAIHFHGAELVAMFPVSQVAQGQALNMSVISYRDQLAFGFVACRDSVPSVQRLSGHMAEALDELEGAFPPRGAKHTVKGAKRSKRPSRRAHGTAKSARGSPSRRVRKSTGSR